MTSTKPKVIVTASIRPDKTHTISGHIFEVLEYAVYLYTKWKKYFDIVIWFPSPYTKRFIYRLALLRYTDHFLQLLSNMHIQIVDSKFIIQNVIELSNLLKKSCVVSTNGRFLYFMDLPLKPFIIHTFVGLHCYYSNVSGFFIRNMHLLYNDKIYRDHKEFKPHIFVVSSKFSIYKDYVKKIAYSCLRYSKTTKKDLGNILVDKDSLLTDHILDGIDTIIFKSKESRNLFKKKFKQYNIKLLTYPIAHFLSRIKMYRVVLPKQYNFDCSNRLIKECQYFNIPVDIRFANVSCIRERFKEPLYDIMNGDDCLDLIIEEFCKDVF